MNVEDELNLRVNEVLYYLWDPIGVNDLGPAARDEYDSYVAEITKAILKGADSEEISVMLRKIETEWMEIEGKAETRKEVAELLIDWFEHLKN